MADLKVDKVPVSRQRDSSFQHKTASPVSESQLQTFDNRAMGLQTDDQKWNAAVERTKMQFQDDPRVSDSEFKKALDTAYDSYNPEVSARERRGENAWTDFVGGARDVINGINTGIGSGLDFAFDTAFATPLEIMGAKDAGKTVRNWFDGEDLAIIPDIATDVALVASGVGIPAMIAKNAIQLSPQMAQGISGKDAVTLEKMDAGQQAANAAMGFGGLALAAIPGIGKGVNVAKATSNKAAQEAIEDAAVKATTAFDDAEPLMNLFKKNGNFTSGGKKRADDWFMEQIEKGAQNLDDVDKVKDIARTEAEASKKALSEAEDAFNKAQAFADMNRGQRVAQVLAEDAKGFGRGITSIPSAISETRQAAKGAKNARGLARKANAEASNGQAPVDKFNELLEEAAQNAGKTKQEFADEIGVKLNDKGTAIDVPVKNQSKAERAGRKAKREARRSGTTDKEKLNTIYDDAVSGFKQGAKLNPSGYKGYGPLRAAQNYYRSAMDNVLEKANAGAPGLIDERALLQRLGWDVPSRFAKEEGIKGAAKRGGEAGLGLLGRAGSSAAGWASGVGMLPLAEVAQNGGSLGDAFNTIGARMASGEVSPFAIAPMLLTGSKNISKRVNPGLKGKVGMSSVPHNAMRSLSAAERWGNIGESTDNDGFISAINNLAKDKKEEE